jgi:hypothetical protein
MPLVCSNRALRVQVQRLLDDLTQHRRIIIELSNDCGYGSFCGISTSTQPRRAAVTARGRGRPLSVSGLCWYTGQSHFLKPVWEKPACAPWDADGRLVPIVQCRLSQQRTDPAALNFPILIIAANPAQPTSLLPGTPAARFGRGRRYAGKRKSPAARSAWTQSYATDIRS